MSEFTHKVEEYEKRFGVTAIELGFITGEQLVDALRVQVHEDLNDGKHRLLGQILRDMGLMRAEQIEQVLTKSLNLR